MMLTAGFENLFMLNIRFSVHTWYITEDSRTNQLYVLFTMTTILCMTITSFLHLPRPIPIVLPIMKQKVLLTYFTWSLDPSLGANVEKFIIGSINLIRMWQWKEPICPQMEVTQLFLTELFIQKFNTWRDNFCCIFLLITSNYCQIWHSN